MKRLQESINTLLKNELVSNEHLFNFISYLLKGSTGEKEHAVLIRGTVESKWGYQLIPAAELLEKNHLFTLTNFELLLSNAKHRTIAEIIISCQKGNIQNQIVSSHLQDSIQYIWGISEFLRLLSEYNSELMNTENFIQICQQGEIFNNEEVWSAILDFYNQGNRFIQSSFNSIIAACKQNLPIDQIIAKIKGDPNAPLEDNADQPKKKYDTTLVNQSVKEREEALVDVWKKMDIFHQGIRREGAEKFITYDGPPFATGTPHYGHILAMSIKDTFASYQALNGKDVETRFGWDCHGVPVEYQIEKQHQLMGHQDINDRGIAWFNEECRSIVFTCAQEWYRDTKRLGRFINMDDDYKTLNVNYMESVWNVFNTLQQKGLVYEGKKVEAYSAKLGTVLSDFESKLNYKEIQESTVTMEFPFKDDPQTRLLVWTTTPWSVPANVAIAINKNLSYVKVTTKAGINYLLAKNLMLHYFPKDTAFEEIPVEKIIGKEYIPMFNSMPKDLDPQQFKNCFRVLHSDHVTEESGSGCVHICPAYGEDDYNLGLQHNLPIVDFIDANGNFINFYEYDLQKNMAKGKFFKDADQEIKEHVKNKNRLFKESVITHPYPFCWRTETPLMYRAISSWFVNVLKIKKQMIENNKKVQWHPDFVGQHRFHDWLINAHDWAISRNRYWGNPIPIWRNTEDPNDIIFVSSRAQLEELSGRKIDDLHRHFIDDVMIERNGKQYKRIPEVFDCWFESGCMPYAQVHFPFENEDSFIGTHFPAHFVAEGLDQTRGWFYALTVIGNAFMNRPPFDNVVVNGILLGNDGKKMSKSKGNFPPIARVFDTYGADAIRLFLLSSRATQAQEISIKDELIEDMLRKVIIPVLNAYKFFADMANHTQITIEGSVDILELKSHLANPLDKWFIYQTELFKTAIKKGYDDYDLIEVGKQILTYVDVLTNWYIRNIRTRMKTDSQLVLQLLHYALDTFCHYAAPMTPFVTDAIYRELYGANHSVHLQLLPRIHHFPDLAADFQNIELVRKLYYISLSVREQQGIRLRQPLAVMYLDKQLKDKLSLYIDMLKEITNVEAIKWVSSKNDLLEPIVQLNYNVLGKTYKKDFQVIQKALKENNFTLKDNNLEIAGFQLSMQRNEFAVNFKPKSNELQSKTDGSLWLMLDTALTPDLVEKGALRDFIRDIQQQRKELGLKKTEKACLFVKGTFVNLMVGKEEEIFQKTNTKIVYDNELDKKDLKIKPIKISGGNQTQYTGVCSLVSLDQLSAKQNHKMGMFARKEEASSIPTDPVLVLKI